MKKISYFGTEYMVDDGVKWVATSLSGNVITFAEKPWIIGSTWASCGSGSHIDICGVATKDWQNSLRKVEDILVKGNRLKIGDKVMVNKDVCGFKKGQIVEVYKLNNDGIHLFKGDNPKFNLCDGDDGAYLWDCNYDVIEDTPATSGHPHADLILKYAMIAQYDAEPWKYFEYETSDGWATCLSMAAFNENVNYRLKPQEPVVQVGQKWKSKEGVEVEVVTPVISGYTTTRIILGGENIYWSFTHKEFLKNFKRKE